MANVALRAQAEAERDIAIGHLKAMVNYTAWAYYGRPGGSDEDVRELNNRVKEFEEWLLNSSITA